MSIERRRQMIDPDHPELSFVRQCELVSISRSGFYYQPAGETPLNLELMRLIDRQFLETPWYGSRQMARHLRREGYAVGRKRIRRLMAKMGRGWPKVPAAKPLERPDEGGADLPAAAHDGSAPRAPDLSVSAARDGD
jgi:transposase InsO family protein